MGNVKKVEPYSPSPEVIEFLESLLDQAKRGVIQGIAVVTLNPEATTGYAWVGVNDRRMVMLAEMDCMKMDFYLSDIDSKFKQDRGL